MNRPIDTFDDSNAQFATWCQLTSQKQRLLKRKHLIQLKQCWTKFSHCFIVARIRSAILATIFEHKNLTHFFIRSISKLRQSHFFRKFCSWFFLSFIFALLSFLSLLKRYFEKRLIHYWNFKKVCNFSFSHLINANYLDTAHIFAIPSEVKHVQLI